MTPPARPGDDGFTLTELVVVIVLFAIIGGIVATASVIGLRGQSQVQDRNDALAQLRTAMQRVERDIRSSSGLGLVRGDEIVTVQAQSTGTTFVTYAVVAAGSSYDLVVYKGAVPFAGTPSTLLSHIVNPATSPVFAVSPAAGYTAPTDGSVNGTTCANVGTSPTSYDPSCIGVVTIHLMVQPTTLHQPIDLTDNGTELRNPG